MDIVKRTVRKESFVPRFTTGYERLGFTPKKDLQVFRTGFKPPKYSYVVEWQMDEDVSKTEMPRF